MFAFIVINLALSWIVIWIALWSGGFYETAAPVLVLWCEFVQISPQIIIYA